MNTLRVVLFAICFKPLRNRYPSLFDGRVALEQIELAMDATLREERL